MDDARPRIHLIEKRGYIKKLKDVEREYESGWWPVSEETAQSLIGGLVLFHETRTKPSFFGGNDLGVPNRDGGGIPGPYCLQGRVLPGVQERQGGPGRMGSNDEDRPKTMSGNRVVEPTTTCRPIARTTAGGSSDRSQQRRPLTEKEKWPREPEKGKSSAQNAMRGSKEPGPRSARSAVMVSRRPRRRKPPKR